MGRPRLALALCGALTAAACRPTTPTSAPVPVSAPRTAPARVQPAALPPNIVPAPVSLTAGGEPYTLAATTGIYVEGGDEATRVAQGLAAWLRKSTGFAMPVTPMAPTTPAGAIVLRLEPQAAGALGGEGYNLTVTSSGVLLSAAQPAGLFHAVQTLRQLFPPLAESDMIVRGPGGAWMLPAVRIADQPRFAWRGAMLDVARHFFTVDEVKQYIDMLAMYKLNVLHLHLADDQGWRIDIRSRPRLATVGGSSQVGGGPGGFYTQEQYADIVRYAQERYVTVVPEIDMPSHINAALVAFPELSCSRAPRERARSDSAPQLYSGTQVGWSALCVDNEATYQFIDDVVREIAAITPGPYFHMGGDEVEILTHEQYVRFVERVQEIVARHGKRMVGWEEIAKARLQPSSLAQQWKSDSAVAAVQQGVKLILSPSDRLYVDMKFTPETELGLSWAGVHELRDAYDWDPATYMRGVGESNIVGIEAPLWTETVRNLTAAQYLVMPRIPAVAEVGWTPAAGKDWERFRQRLATHAPRWNYLGINWYRSPQVQW